VAKAAFAQKCFAGLTVMFLVSCAAEPRYYGPKQPGESVGYTDSGNSATARDMVENFLLMRAAEVTLQSGYSHFLFDARDTKAKTTYLSDFTGWPGWGGGWYWHSWPDAFGGPPFDAQAESRPITKFEAYAEIVMLTPVEAAKETRAIDARQIIARLGPLVAPPPAAPAKPWFRLAF
jgi:hypothetical protein